MSDKRAPAAARSAAAQAILDRGYGKPSHHMSIEEQRPMAILSEEPMSEEEWQRQMEEAQCAMITKAIGNLLIKHLSLPKRNKWNKQ